MLGAKSLSNLLERNQLISFLDLRNLHIGDKHCKVFAQGILKNSTILYLNLSRNDLTFESSSDLSKSLKHSII